MTKTELEVLKAIRDFQGYTGYPPSIPELCDKIGMVSASVMNYHLESLEKLGYIHRDRRISRGIWIHPSGYEKLEEKNLTNQIERKFSKEVSDEREVRLGLGKFIAYLRWDNGKNVWKRISFQGRSNQDRETIKIFSSVSEIENLRDLLNSMLKELQEVPEE